jgi:Zn-dependent alcohol dehydrogenase
LRAEKTLEVASLALVERENIKTMPPIPPQKARAIVTRGPHTKGAWNIEEISLRPLKPDELLVQIVASGICHTDIVFGDNAEEAGVGGWPRVMGHEGNSV